MPYWLVVQTHSGAECKARDALTAPYRNCVVSLPLENVTVVHARRKRDVERPFLSRLVFVQDQGQDLRIIKYAPGVSHLPRFGDRLILLRQGVVDHLEQRVAELNQLRGVVRGLPKADLFVPGQGVRVTNGPFASFNGLFECGYNDRAKIAVDIFGRKTPVELEYNQFEAA